MHKTRNMPVTEHLNSILRQIDGRAKLVAVSKTKPEEAILQAYNAGQKVFGENKVQELVSKYESLPKDIEWHMIGHLQSNKVKYIAPFVSLIHGVDSIKLLNTINKEGGKAKRKVPCLLQIHIAKEDTKFGFSQEEVMDALSENVLAELEFVDIQGVMGMATYSDDEALIRSEFAALKLAFDQLKRSVFKNTKSFKEVSMGMSGDFMIAIEEGSTIVRVGSSIFGERQYRK